MFSIRVLAAFKSAREEKMLLCTRIYRPSRNSPRRVSKSPLPSMASKTSSYRLRKNSLSGYSSLMVSMTWKMFFCSGIWSWPLGTSRWPVAVPRSSTGMYFSIRFLSASFSSGRYLPMA